MDAELLPDLYFFLFNEAVFSSLGDNNHAMALDLGPLNDGVVDPVSALELEVHFRHDADVHIPACQGRGNRDVAAVPAHQFDDAHAVLSRFGFHIGSIDELHGFFAGGLETEGAVDEGDVVVYGLGDAYHGYLAVLVPQFLLESHDAAVGAVAANDVELVDALGLEGLDDLSRVEAATGGAEDGASEVLDAVHSLRVERDPVLREFLVKAPVAPLDSPDLPDFVVIVEAVHEGSDNHVQARAQAAAGDNGGLDLRSFEVDLGTGACSVELEAGLELQCVRVELLLEHEGAVLDEALGLDDV